MKTLKFTGYIYLPQKKDHLKYAATHLGNGRLTIYDENKKPITKKAMALDIGGMMAKISNAYNRRATKNLQNIGLLNKSPARKK